MPELFVTSGPNLGKTYAVESGASIGRSPDCAVQLSHKSISRKHAHIEVDGGRWALIDDGSRNGVFLDEKRVERIELSDGLEGPPYEWRVGRCWAPWFLVRVTYLTGWPRAEPPS